ncbi:uncharacterized protein BXZ73DRAFT_93392 [Epithele typhae]|uniref:uncharacterized protein n=1 Tax=Epithele typhae TaxID=378194 RepID=UPI002007B72B|nr:uncharacterized protein BXZ73DRAFT_93392 [Epithele typhae]KAH9911437.1 hypothetical protein BXZ73DRAFT_93392 [Epithele typhae]
MAHVAVEVDPVILAQEEERLRKAHPTPDDVPSCTKLMDDFLLCHALGSQVRSLYRYGSTSKCSNKWEDFKFCMSLKSLHPEEKRDVWIRRRAEWWALRRQVKSSEDVWEVRTEPLENFPARTIDPSIIRADKAR